MRIPPPAFVAWSLHLSQHGMRDRKPECMRNNAATREMLGRGSAVLLYTTSTLYTTDTTE